MAKRSITPGDRKRRIVRDAVLLLVVLILLAFTLDFPMLTARQALKATQTRYLFEDGEIVAELPPNGMYDRQYLLRDGDWYAWCGFWRYGPFWRPGRMEIVQPDPDRPLTAYDPTGSEEVWILSSDPAITQVEVEYLAETTAHELVLRLASVRQGPVTESCWWFSLPDVYWGSSPEDLRLRGYDADGRLIYESPRPESWDRDYTILNDP